MKKPIYTKESDLLCKWLTDRRQKASLTQRELGDLLQVHHSIVGKIETGERQIGAIELVQYCKVLKADILEIIELLKDCQY